MESRQIKMGMAGLRHLNVEKRASKSMQSS